MLAILAAIWSSIGAYVIAFALIASAVLIGYEDWKYHIEQQALVDFNKAQAAQNAADLQKFKEAQDAINQVQQKILDDQQDATQDIDKQLSNVTDFLNQPATIKASKPSSVIIKKTLDKLNAGG